VTVQVNTASGGASAYAEAYCPAGATLTGGGVLAGPGDAITINAPVHDGNLVRSGQTANGWAGSVDDGGLFASTFVNVYALCAGA